MCARSASATLGLPPLTARVTSLPTLLGLYDLPGNIEVKISCSHGRGHSFSLCLGRGFCYRPSDSCHVCYMLYVAFAIHTRCPLLHVRHVCTCVCCVLYVCCALPKRPAHTEPPCGPQGPHLGLVPLGEGSNHLILCCPLVLLP